ncbi:MAG: FAD-dependent oxidoreductase [Oscillospiraceae bacterium]|nr:FAD-dependent oxidoreductase [Oscillospiraceae bacterium]
MALHVMDEANRCLGCKVPQCQRGCPISTPIPEVIRLLKANKLDEAGWLLFENNPLTTVCSLICNHENQCEGHCVLGKKGAPVRFSLIEQYFSSTYATKMTRGPSPSNGMKVAVVGSDPAGLTIAILMARKGYQVTIFDRNEHIGGVLRYGIPEFRLPKSVPDDIQYRHLEMKGIKIRPNTNIGSTIDMENLFRDGYKAVFVGTGVWKPNTLGIKGETLGHVHYGINYLRNPDVFRPGKKVIVIGSGNAAMDVCRTALRKGTEKVICVSRRQKITASHHEFSYAQLEGVEFVYNKMPVEIVDEGVILRDLVEDENGKLTEIEGSDTLWTADSIMISVSQGPLNLIVSNTPGLDTTPRGLLAVAFSKRVAEAMDEYIQALPKE